MIKLKTATDICVIGSIAIALIYSSYWIVKEMTKNPKPMPFTVSCKPHYPTGAMLRNDELLMCNGSVYRQILTPVYTN